LQPRRLLPTTPSRAQNFGLTSRIHRQPHGYQTGEVNNLYPILHWR
jgi:hypothetical protein